MQLSVDLIPRLLVSLVLLGVIGASAKGIWWLLHPASALEIRPFEIIKGGEVQKGQLEMTARVLTSKLRDITGVLHVEASPHTDEHELGLQLEGPFLPEVVLGERQFNLQAFNVDVGGIFGTLYKTLYNGPVLQGAVILSDKGAEVLAEYIGDGHKGLGRFNSISAPTLDSAIESLAYRIALDFCRANDPQFAQLTDDDFRLYVAAMKEYRRYEESRGHSEAEMERHVRAMAAILEKSPAKERTSTIIYSALDAVYRYSNVPEQTESLLEKVVAANPEDVNAKKKLAGVQSAIERKRKLVGDDERLTLVGLRKQAAFNAIHVNEAMAAVANPKPVTVAILADGNVPTDEGLKGSFLPAPGQGHEGFSLTANLASLVIGVCPSAKILAVNAITVSDFVHGVQEAEKAGARVALIAVGGSTQNTLRTQAINDARRANVLFVAAAGNDSSDRKVFPAAIEGVVAVGATDNAGRRARFSNHGSWVALGAPGVDIETLDRNGDARQVSGTSYAAAIAAGAAAQVLASNPQLSAEAVDRILRKTAVVPRGAPAEKTGAGRIDVLAAVKSH